MVCLVNIENRSEPVIDLVNDVVGEAGTVFFVFVGGYLWMILEDCSKLKDRVEMAQVPTARLATHLRWGV